MDNDGHKIYDSTGRRINEPREVVFGDHIWMGCGCLVLKGSRIADDNDNENVTSYDDDNDDENGRGLRVYG